MSVSQEWLDYFRLWQWETDPNGKHHSPEWARYSSPQNAERVKAEALKLSYYPCVSAFVIAFDKLRSSGAIQQVRAAKATATQPKEFTLTRDEYLRLSASESKRRYAVDPAFRDALDDLIARGEV